MKKDKKSKDDIRQKYKQKYKEILQEAFKTIQDEDLLYKGYLKPIEIHLKTCQTPESNGSNQFPQRSLPIGLRVAVKDSITNNRYDLKDIQQINGKPSLQELRASCQDNLLTLMKGCNEIELAICVCMCNEDKRMLKTTLAGIEENISQIVTREKISSDKIGVFVMMDGIDKIDPSCAQYFEEMENYSGISLAQNIAPNLTTEEMIIRARNKSPQELCKEQLKNIKNFLFDPIERVDINERRFNIVKNEYDEIIKLKADIQKLKEKEKSNKKINYHDLPGKLKQFFIAEAQWLEKADQSNEAANQQHEKENDQKKNNQFGSKQKEKETEKIFKKQFTKQRKFPEEYLMLKYTEDPHKGRSMILKALSEGENYCNDYINTRQNLAYLACFRKKVRHSLDKLPPKKKKTNKYSVINLNEQIEEPTHSTTMNLFLCVKYKNGGKLSSHNWFFNGFCKELQPKYAVLLDVGLKPDKKALLKMYRYLKKNNDVGGVCGYMSLKIEQIDDKDQIKDEEIDFFSRFWLNFVDIQRTQQVEYHFAHLIDKSFQSAFGFIHVLPGAFSAYNMQTILKYGEEEDQLIKSYFKSINGSKRNDKITPTNLSIKSILLRTLLPNFINSCFIDIDPNSEEQMLYNENIYLAEDRILCMGIHKKQKKIFYLPEARATVDPIKFLFALFGQRKRWNNGSLFAFQKVKIEMQELWSTSKMQLFLRFQILYLTLMNSFSFFAPSFFLFSIHIAMQAFRVDVLPNLLGGVIPDPNNNQLFKGFVYFIDFIYVLLVMSIILFSLLMKNDKKQFKSCMYLITTLLGMFAIIVFIVLMVDVIRGFLNSSAYLIENKEMTEDIPGGITTIDAMRWMLIGSTGVYALPVLVHIILYKRLSILFQIIQGAFSFLFYGPTYLIALNIYSLCRIDDISWGTKGLNSDKSDNNKQMKDSWRVIKFLHVSKYIFWNLILSVILLSFGSSYTPRFFITIIVVAVMTLIQSIKVIIAILYLLWYKITNVQPCNQPRVFYLNELSRFNDDISLYKEQIIKEIQSRLLDIIIEFEQNLKDKTNGETLFEISRSYRQVIKSQAKLKKMKQMKNEAALSTIVEKMRLNTSQIIDKDKKKLFEFDRRLKKKQQKSKNKRKQICLEQESHQRILIPGGYQKQAADDRNDRTSFNSEYYEDQITKVLESNNYRYDLQ